jgi:hypothetical protein
MMLGITRRKFLKIFAVAAGAVGSGIYVFSSSGESVISLLDRVKEGILLPEFREDETGALDDRTLNILLKTAEAVTFPSIDNKHYEDFYKWRSENLKGYRSLYINYALSTDIISQQKYGRTFLDCSIDDCASMISEMIPDGKLEKLRFSFFHREWILYYKYIFHETLSLFAATDAWKLLGYESWPGRARGLRRYRNLPVRNS